MKSGASAGRVSELFSLHLERLGRVSLNRAIFMLTEQNTYNVKQAARCKETRGKYVKKTTFQAWMTNLDCNVKAVDWY